MKQLCQILLQQLNVNQEDIDNALQIQDDKGGSLSRILIRQKKLDEHELLDVFSQKFTMSKVSNLPPEIITDFTSIIPISFLKKNMMVPVASENEAYIAVNDPFSFQALDELRDRIGWDAVKPVLCPHAAIISAINFAYDMTQDSAEEVIQDIDSEDPEALFSEIDETADLLDDTSNAPVIKLVNLMFAEAIRDKASDIHIEPYQNSLKIRKRLDGILYDMLSPPKHVQAALISRIKIMAKLNIAEKRLPQDGRIDLKVGNKDVNIRVSTLPTAFGERVVLRLLDKSTVLISLSDLGMPDDRFIPFSEQIKAANGIVLVTGPTGSGKTTTLYAALTSINSTEINIITVEDPIEYQISGIGQVQINQKIGLTFASGLRSIVRQDPDVILVGEIRDRETAEIAIQSSLTGHLVFSTLHTNDAASAITRLLDMGVEPFLLTSSINAILAQRLVRIICPECKEAYTPDSEALRKLGINQEEIGDRQVYRGKGCSNCHHTGYKGRCGIYELMIMNEELEHLILQESSSNAIKKQAVADGLITLHEDGASKVLQGVTTIEEVYRVAHE